MDLRDLWQRLAAQGQTLAVDEPLSPVYGVAERLLAHAERPTRFAQVAGSPFAVVGGLCSRREWMALGLGVAPADLTSTLEQALARPTPPPRWESGPCQEVVQEPADLETLPILTHFPGDPGPYITAGVLAFHDPQLGSQNLSFHRLLRLDGRRLAARLVEGRGAHTAWARAEGDLPVAVCLGAPMQVLMAGAMSPPPGLDELTLAQALDDTPLVPTLAGGLWVPAACEIVLEGRLTHHLANEGPFVDLTGTRDPVRRQPVIEVERITHRREAIYQALLPGGLEHRLLMGLPREPTIFSEVNKVARCSAVRITLGGCSWLHAVVQIRKEHPDDGRRAAEAAFRGHSSLKHVVVVDDDVDPDNPYDVEWAIATRFQAGRDLLLWPDQPSSSLDPSARHVPGQKSRTDKMALDATVAWDTSAGPSDPEAFRRVMTTRME
ncbi:MAG: UbiD family decarboxylase [Chloroflexi bacterium]|nr:UbiD family decarboxylase [Chloroflexota bacterium]